jgi:hypothetical protein
VREWFMASDIAQLGRAGVAGLPKSKSQAQIFLQRSLSLRQRRTHSGQGDGLLSDLCRRARGRRGGGFEYHASILPESVRLAIYQYELQFAAGPANAVLAAASSPLQTATAPGRELIQMPLWARRTADARAAVLDALAHFAAVVNAATATSPIVLARFAESYNAGHITVDASGAHLGAELAEAEGRGALTQAPSPYPLPGQGEGFRSGRGIGIPQVSAPTLLRWHRQRMRGGLAALAPRYGNRRGSGIFDTNPAVHELVLAMIARYGKHLRAPRVAEAIAAIPLPDLGEGKGEGASDSTTDAPSVEPYFLTDAPPYR